MIKVAEVMIHGMVTSCSMNESEMGNRGSKSDINLMKSIPSTLTLSFKNISVKEQRVDGS